MAEDFRTDLWHYLQMQDKPIVLYGMGNGADKILSVMERYQLHCSGVFASDGFVRNKQFHGMPISSYTDIRNKYGDGHFITLLSFASALPDVLDTIRRIDSENELYAPDVPAFGNTLFTIEFYREHAAQIGSFRSLLADDESVRILDQVLAYKLSGRISCLLNARSDPAETYTGILHPQNYRITADLGAYRGDTIQELEHYAEHLEEIIAFEPDERTFRKLSDYAETDPRVSAYPLAAWSHAETLRFSASGGRGASLNQSARIREVQGQALDNVVGRKHIDYIKYDVEGSEKEALEGSSGTIARCHPEMLISLYHRSEDIFSLPAQVHTIYPEGKMFLRRPGGIPAWDLNLLIV